MALNIRDPETHRLARAVADATGETMTEAVKTALRERLARIADSTRRSASSLRGDDGARSTLSSVARV